MKVGRLGVIVLAALVTIVIAIAMALNAGVQTWVVRRVLASRPDWHASVRRVSVGLDGLRIDDLRLERGSVAVSMPSIEADLPVIPAVFSRRVSIGRLVAKGWTIDFSKSASAAEALDAVDNGGGGPPARQGNAEGPAEVTGASATSPCRQSGPASAAAAFQGIFDRLRLPVDARLDGVESEGDVILPAGPHGGPIRAHVAVDGGGLAPGREGRFTFAAAIGIPDPDSPVNSLRVDGTAGAEMDGGRGFRLLWFRVAAVAAGPRLPHDVHLTARASARKEPSGESYSLTIAGESKDLLSVRTEFSEATRRFSGNWMLNAGDADVGPFALGRPLPSFSAVGQGRFESDRALAETHVSGTLDVSADRLASVSPMLAGVGAVRLVADFDLAHRGSRIRVDRLKAAVSGARPNFSMEGLQPFALDLRTGELQVAHADNDLFGIALQELPLEWAQPFLRGLAVTADPLRGEIVASARNGGLTVRSKAPLAIAGLTVRRGQRLLVRDVDVVLSASTDYTPEGWQVDVSNGAVTGKGSQGPPMLAFSMRAGRLSGAGRPMKAEGRLSAFLPALLSQPAFRGGPSGPSFPALKSGDLACEFTAKLTAPEMVQASLTVSGLAAPAPLPKMTAELRAEEGRDGRIAFSAPLSFETADRRSDLAMAGSLKRSGNGIVLDGQVTSMRLFVDDARALALLFFGQAQDQDAPGESGRGPARGAPAWSGVTGRVTVALEEVDGPGFALKDLGGAIGIGPASLSADGLRAKWGKATFAMDAKVGFNAANAEPYTLQGSAQAGDFDPAIVFRLADPGRPPTVEGKFDMDARLRGTGLNLADLAERVRGDCQIVSRGGVFRMLSATVAPKVEAAGEMASIGAFLGNVTGRKEGGEAAGAAQAIASFAKLISPIHYDQLSLVLSRDSDLNTSFEDFALIAPEVRLTGSGQVTHQAGTPFLGQPLSMAFKLRARGRTADLLKLVGALDPAADDLGYRACTLPLEVGGTLSNPDKSEVEEALARLAAERAGDFLDKLLGN